VSAKLLYRREGLLNGRRRTGRALTPPLIIALSHIAELVEKLGRALRRGADGSLGASA
jgi:hypothetical protein